VNEIYGKVL